MIDGPIDKNLLLGQVGHILLKSYCPLGANQHELLTRTDTSIEKKSRRNISNLTPQFDSPN